MHPEFDLQEVNTKRTEARVAILLATFNGERFLERQLSTLLSQKDVSVEIFISDDVSTDNTLKIIKRNAATHKNISIVSYDKKFGSASRNFYHLIKSVDVSSFDYIAFSDQDDIWADKKLINATSFLGKYQISAYSSNFYAVWEKNAKHVLIKKNYPQTEIDHWFEGPGPGCSQVFNIEAFSEFKVFIKKHWHEVQDIRYHDWLVYAFFRHRGFEWHISKNADLFYMQHDNNEIGANNGIIAIVKRFKMLKSGWYRNQVQLIYSVVTGNAGNILHFPFLVKNKFLIRRNKIHAFFLSIAIILNFI